MAATFRNRQIQINQVTFDQVDIFQSDVFNRVTGLIPSNMGFVLMLNNEVVTWPLVDGTAVQDSQVVSGSVYWNQLANGSYGIRLYVNSLGHWNLIFSYASIPQIVSIDYDVVNIPVSSDTGFKASFC